MKLAILAAVVVLSGEAHADPPTPEQLACAIQVAQPARSARDVLRYAKVHLIVGNGYGLDPVLLAAVADVETDNRDWIEGPKGERGLYQYLRSDPSWTLARVHAKSGERLIRWLRYHQRRCMGRTDHDWWLHWNQGGGRKGRLITERNARSLKAQHHAAYDDRVGARLEKLRAALVRCPAPRP